MRSVILGVIGILSAEVAQAKSFGGFAVCIHAPPSWSEAISFQYRSCFDMKGTGNIECTEWGTSKIQPAARGKIQVKMVDESWSEGTIDQNTHWLDQTGHMQIRYDESFEPGFQEGLYRINLRFRMNPRRGVCSRQDSTFQFVSEDNMLKLYKGCPSAKSDCADDPSIFSDRTE